MFWLYRQISWPYVKQAPWRVLLTIIGVAIGVATVVATDAISRSILTGVSESLQVAMGSADARVSNGGAGVPYELGAEVLGVRGVVAAEPIVQRTLQVFDRNDMAIGSTTMLGIDLAGELDRLYRLPRTAVNVPDESMVLSVEAPALVPKDWISDGITEVGGRLRVATTTETQRVTVVGTLDLPILTRTFADRLIVLDLNAASKLFHLDGRADYVDVWLADAETRQESFVSLELAVQDHAVVTRADSVGNFARDLLFAIRVFLYMAAFVSVVVGFFVVHNTIVVSIMKRQQDLAILCASGIGRGDIFRWLLGESFVLATIAGVIGLVLGSLIARIAFSPFRSAASAWVESPESSLHLSIPTIGVAWALAITVTMTATWMAFRKVTSRSIAQILTHEFVDAGAAVETRIRFRTSVVMWGLAVLLIIVAPRTLPLYPLVAFLLSVLGLILAGFGMLGPAVSSWFARFVAPVLRNHGSLPAFLAVSNLARSRYGLVVVATAIVMALGATISSLSLTRSLEGTSKAWIRGYYDADLIVAARGSILQVMAAPALPAELLQELENHDSIDSAEGIRAVRVDYDSKPAVLLAVDGLGEGFRLSDEVWGEVQKTFRAGEGALVTENFSRLRGVDTGDRIQLRSPSGRVELPILGKFPDYIDGSQTGAIVIDREYYRARWYDSMVSRVRLSLDPDADSVVVKEEVRNLWGKSYGVEAFTIDDVDHAVSSLLDQAFYGMYALVLVSLLVCFIGVTNFFMIALTDRKQEIRAMRGLGLSRDQILKTLMIEAGAIGAVSSFLGFLAGFVASVVIVRHSVAMVTGWSFDLYFPTLSSIVICVFIVVFSTLAGFVPSVIALSRPIGRQA